MRDSGSVRVRVSFTPRFSEVFAQAAEESNRFNGFQMEAVKTAHFRLGVG
jgi:hypothetical protein